MKTEEFLQCVARVVRDMHIATQSQSIALAQFYFGEFIGICECLEFFTGQQLHYIQNPDGHGFTVKLGEKALHVE